MTEKNKPKLIWWVVVIRIVLILPFFLLGKLGEKFQQIADWLSDSLPHPFKYATKRCPVCGGSEGEYLRDTGYKTWRPCSRCDGKGWVKNV